MKFRYEQMAGLTNVASLVRETMFLPYDGPTDRSTYQISAVIGLVQTGLFFASCENVKFL